MGTPHINIEANPAQLNAASDDLYAASVRCLAVADALASIDTSGWTNQTADAYRERMQEDPEDWQLMGRTFSDASDATAAFAHDVTALIRSAEDAVSDCHRARYVYDSADPQDPDRELLMQRVREADQEAHSVERRFEARASEYAQEMRSLANRAPEPPRWWEQIWRGGVGAKEALWDGLLKPVFTASWKGVNGRFPETELLGVGMFAMGLWGLGKAFCNDPWDTSEQIWWGLWDPFYDNPASASGEFLSGFIPGAGAAGKVGGIAGKAARGLGGARSAGGVPTLRRLGVEGKPKRHPDLVRLEDPASFRHPEGVDFKPTSSIPESHNTLDKRDGTEPRKGVTGPYAFERGRVGASGGKPFVAAKWPGLTARDLQIIYDYSLEIEGLPTGYKAMNKAVRGPQPPTQEVSDAVRNLNAVLFKIPPRPGTYHRVIGGYPNWESNLTEGNVITESFLSTSDKILPQFLKEAREQATPEYPCIKMEVRSVSGRRLPVTAFPAEKEVLHPAGTKFKVLGCTKISDDPPEYQVVLEEVP